MSNENSRPIQIDLRVLAERIDPVVFFYWKKLANVDEDLGRVIEAELIRRHSIALTATMKNEEAA